MWLAVGILVGAVWILVGLHLGFEMGSKISL
jgi:hypothetical protein